MLCRLVLMSLREVKVSCLWVACKASGARQTFKPVQEPQPRDGEGGSSNTTGRWSGNKARVPKLISLEELDQSL
jgi:hypothetical protein